MRASKIGKVIAASTVLLTPFVVVPAAIAEVVDIGGPERGWVAREPGTVESLGSIDVAAEDQGKVCEISVFASNGISIHPGNALLITSGSESGRVEGIEAVSNFTGEDAATLTVSDTIDFSLEFGEDGVSSLDLSVELDCTIDQPEPEVTTTTTDVLTPVEPETTSTTVEVLSEVDEVTPVTQAQLAETTTTTTGSASADGEAAPATAVEGAPVYTG